MLSPKQNSWVTVSALICCLNLSSATAAQDNDNLEWSITPYLWAPTTKVDLTLRDTAIGSGEISFDDLLDTLDTAFMLQVEAGKGKWSGFLDMSYLATSATTQRTLLTVNVDSKQIFIDLAAAFWPGGVGSPFSIFGGLRFSGFDDTFRFSISGTEIGKRLSGEDYYDALLGLRYRFDFSKRWQLLTHGDFSFGDSDGALLLRANFGYIVGKKHQNRILFGYQYKQADFRDGDLIKDFTYHGPTAGFNFRF